ncbi:hypothetical protein C0Q70_20819 [Pomacea canaliculata]|uniref:Uncharacterized protein n=1 Tax=Pomacea canaliculata TaxID=400727 RepID=A0A2T7NAR2_POMCA|nr:chitinase-like protein PB1E7.04c [Pomacea canaliculata]PVD18270.1 hypothetical protein C0Q70_20819 [Pomacea canaliculata]
MQYTGPSVNDYSLSPTIQPPDSSSVQSITPFVSPTSHLQSAGSSVIESFSSFSPSTHLLSTTNSVSGVSSTLSPFSEMQSAVSIVVDNIASLIIEADLSNSFLLTTQLRHTGSNVDYNFLSPTIQPSCDESIVPNSTPSFSPKSDLQSAGSSIINDSPSHLPTTPLLSFTNFIADLSPSLWLSSEFQYTDSSVMDYSLSPTIQSSSDESIVHIGFPSSLLTSTLQSVGSSVNSPSSSHITTPLSTTNIAGDLSASPLRTSELQYTVSSVMDYSLSPTGHSSHSSVVEQVSPSSVPTSQQQSLDTTGNDYSASLLPIIQPHFTESSVADLSISLSPIIHPSADESIVHNGSPFSPTSHLQSAVSSINDHFPSFLTTTQPLSTSNLIADLTHYLSLSNEVQSHSLSPFSELQSVVSIVVEDPGSLTIETDLYNSFLHTTQLQHTGINVDYNSLSPTIQPSSDESIVPNSTPSSPNSYLQSAGSSIINYSRSPLPTTQLLSTSNFRADLSSSPSLSSELQYTESQFTADSVEEFSPSLSPTNEPQFTINSITDLSTSLSPTRKLQYTSNVDDYSLSPTIQSPSDNSTVQNNL